MKYLLVVLFILYIVLILFVMKSKNLNYKDIDLNSNGFISITEILYTLDTKRRFKCIKNKKAVYLKDMSSIVCEKIYLEIYSLKDGLTLKRTEIK